MNISLKKTLKGILWGFAALLVAAGVGISVLIFPGTPGSSKSLRFQGYVLLPRGKLLTVLDYLSVAENNLFVTDESTGNVYKIVLHGGTLPKEADIATFAAEPAVHGVVVDPASHLAYVTRSEANTVDIFDPANMKLITRIPVADDPDGIFYEPVHKLVYAVSGDAQIATVIDPLRRSIVATIPLGGTPEFAAFDPRTNLIYQNLKDANSVLAVDLEKAAVMQRWPLDNCDGPSGMAIDAPNRRLFIACSANSLLVIFDLDKRRVIQSFPVGGAPDSVAFDAGLRRIYTIGKSGVMVAFQQDAPDAYHLIDRVRLHYGAHTLAVDPVTHTVYVGYASLLVRSRVAVFEARP